MPNKPRSQSINAGLFSYIEELQKAAYGKLDGYERLFQRPPELLRQISQERSIERIIGAYFWDYSESIKNKLRHSIKHGPRLILQSPFALQNEHFFRHLQWYVDMIHKYSRNSPLANVAVPTLATLPVPFFNAFTAKHKDYDGDAIIFNEALLTFLFLQAKIVARFFPAVYIKKVGTLTYKSRELVNHLFNTDAKARRLFMSLLLGLVYKGNPLAETKPYLLDRGSHVVAGHLVFFSELFVFAHELAHIALGHHERDKHSAVLGIDSALQLVNPDKADEFAADSEALSCIMTIADKGFAKIPDSADRLHLAYWGTELALKGLETTEKAITLAKFGYEARIKDYEHPSVEERREALRGIVRANFAGFNDRLGCPNWEVVVYPAEWANRIVDGLWDELKSQIKDRHDRGMPVSKRWDELTEAHVVQIEARA